MTRDAEHDAALLDDGTPNPDVLPVLVLGVALDKPAAAGALAAERQRLKPVLDLAVVGEGELEGQEDRLGRDAADAA
ncbi:hypothetical protein [Streptomyces sp. NPDC006333]|uniref:hypothetical protein n=1 Tax=Streptomyces sp. NPDC006333 TaxID=3156753 RepID=UPI0033B886A2